MQQFSLGGLEEFDIIHTAPVPLVSFGIESARGRVFVLLQICRLWVCPLKTLSLYPLQKAKRRIEIAPDISQAVISLFDANK